MRPWLLAILFTASCTRSAPVAATAEPAVVEPSPSRPAPTKSEPTCPNVDGALSAWIDGAEGRVSVDEQGRASVVVRVEPGAEPPAALAVQTADGDRHFGHLHRHEVCEAASAPGVLSVRAAAIASPKGGPE